MVEKQILIRFALIFVSIAAAVFAQPASPESASAPPELRSAERTPEPAPPPTGATSTTPEAPRRTTRLDLALSVMRFERAMRSAKPEGDALADANRAFDRATMAFFRAGVRGDARNDVLAALDQATLRLSGFDRRPWAEAASSLRVRVDPPVWTRGSEQQPEMVLWWMEEDAPHDAEGLSLLLEPESGGEGVVISLPRAGGGEPLRERRIGLAPSTETFKPGRYALSIVGPDGFRWLIGTWTVVNQSCDVVRAAFESRLDALERGLPQPTPEGLVDRLAVVRSRLALLRDHPSEHATSGFLIDLHSLMVELEADVADLENGREPLKDRTGLVYAPFRSGGATIPMWTHAPASVAASDQPVPLVVALHGAGADEAMFMGGYGGGRIRELADRHGFIVASPLAYGFTLNPRLLDDLVATMRSRFRVDTRRVYLIGHSMGGIAASGLAQARSEVVAAVVAVAGVRPFREDQACAPVLVWAAEHDPIIPARRVSRTVEQAIAQGLPVELREARHQGHTVVVGAVLEESVAWLLGHRLEIDQGNPAPAPERRPVRDRAPQ